MRGLPKHPGAPGPLPVRRPWGSSWPLPLQHRGVLEVPIPVMSPSLQHPHPHGVSHPCRPASGDSTVGEGDERPKLEPGRSTAGSKRERLGRLPQGRRLARPRCRTNTPARTTPSQNPEHAPLRAQKKKKTPQPRTRSPVRTHPSARAPVHARTHTRATLFCSLGAGFTPFLARSWYPLCLRRSSRPLSGCRLWGVCEGPGPVSGCR